jgi:hypothetical protein
MGMSPNTLLIAQIRPVSDSLDEFLESNADIYIEGEAYYVIAYANSDMGIYPDDGYFAIYDYLSSGWGETVDLGTALDIIDSFRNRVQKFCTEKDCTYKLSIGANFC